MKTIYRIGILVVCCLSAAALNAQVISWNLDRYGTINPGDGAGVVLVTNWNNSWPSNPTVDLKDNSGAATTLDLSYGSYGQWSIQGSDPGFDTNGSANKRLLNGYLNAGPAGWNPPVTNSYITLSQIPYAQYDVYVYFSSDVAGRVGNVTDGTTTYYFSTLGPSSISGANALLTQTTDTTGANPGANYAVFAGETASSLTITCNVRDNDQWLGIAGFQVVPEPSTVGLVIFGGASLLCLARRKNRNA